MASGLGFNIRGGSDANYLRGHPGIFVTSIKPGSSADRDGRLKIGDRLLEVHTTLTSKAKNKLTTYGFYIRHWLNLNIE